MKIALFGATGRVGQNILESALNDGHQVKALVRSKLPISHPDLEVIVGDIRKAEDVEKTLQGTEAVFSAIGTDRTTTLTEAMPLVIKTMKANGIRRIITIGTAGILNSRMTPGVLRFQGGDSNRKLTFAAEEHAAVFRLLEKTDLEWTIVCPTYLPDGKAYGDYRVEKDYLPEGGKEITVGDTAEFAYKQLENPEFIGSRVGIAY
ncbi:SDR family oxidoreductase [Planococcus sp. N028]|uniref:SDR family oxidoreductase n=1 Tax=Planococcus shixiaomingii TaxID=3058393 RepID=A0ABT8N5W2_9BACL|nr:MULTISPECIES: SDR family oxidoreductase [unclassified Planococcus (in: firmicutes)]MDN7243276.1 SDR family oxidoreductase [Planococcus sp. N028]WKA55218.1 SDR family oxidoreductase [Planococcus sp. N022]